jgi:hypothetical protein
VISTTVKLSALERAWATLRRPDLRPAWKDARQPMRADIASHRAQQRGPDGSWAPRASSTSARGASSRKNRPKKILGNLPTAIQVKSERRRMALTSRVRWSKVQQKGGVVGHGSRIPGRDWLWASKTALSTIAGIIEKHIRRIWNRV